MFERWLSSPPVSLRRSSLHFILFLMFIILVTLFLLGKIEDAEREIENIGQAYYAPQP